MFYYRVKDYYYNVMSDSLDYPSADEALIAAKEYLVTNNISDGYHIEIYDQPPSEDLVPIQTMFMTTGEVNAYALGKIEPTAPYSDEIMRMVRQRMGWGEHDTSHDDEIGRMTPNEVFDKVLEWEGIIDYGFSLRSWIKNIYGVTLE